MIKLDKVVFDYKAMPMFFDLHIPAEQKVAIIGASGSGKSTLLNLIAGFELAHQGEIWLNQQNHSYSQPFERPISMLFQENNLFPHLTVEQNIGLGINPQLKLNEEDHQKIKFALQAVGLAEFSHRLPTQLSGGQKQRVALARCLLREKPILLLDEPFSALDPLLRDEMLQLFLMLCDQKKLTLLMVTHQLSEVENKVDRILQIEQGRIVADLK